MKSKILILITALLAVLAAQVSPAQAFWLGEPKIPTVCGTSGGITYNEGTGNGYFTTDLKVRCVGEKIKSVSASVMITQTTPGVLRPRVLAEGNFHNGSVMASAWTMPAKGAPAVVCRDGRTYGVSYRIKVILVSGAWNRLPSDKAMRAGTTSQVGVKPKPAHDCSGLQNKARFGFHTPGLF